MMDLRIDTIVVLYNPEKSFIENISKYVGFSHRVYLIDNSSERTQYEQIFTHWPNVHYVFLHGNKGIATALKRGMELCIEDQAEFVLTMDQDSIFPQHLISEIKKILMDTKNEEYGIIGLNFNRPYNPTNEIIAVRWWLTSGNFIRVSAYKELEQGFYEDLFIDAVDSALGYSFYKAGFKVGYLSGISITHTIGNPKVYKILGKQFSTLNYGPKRYYYIFRNNYFLYFKLDKKFFRKDFLKVKYIIFLKIILFEKNKKEKLKAICFGKRDGKLGRLGECHCIK